MVSVVISFAFLALALSGLMLFLSPPGRIANWTNWTLLGLRKSEWAAVHIWFGTIFLLVTAFHVFFNWRPLVSYFKSRVTRQLSWRREWTAGLALCGLVALGTLAAVPPFSSLLAWNERFKESWDTPVAAAPIPHAELLTLAELAEKAGVPLETAVSRLESRGIRPASADVVVQQIADAAGRAPQEIFDFIRTASGESGEHTPRTGSAAGGGLGWKTLAQYCAEQGIAVDVALSRLQAKGFTAEPGLTLREIAQKNGQERPYELIAAIRGE